MTIANIPSNNCGFTLLESLIAMTILAIGILALTTMQITGIKGNATANRITTGSNWAADRIEELFTSKYANINDKHNPGNPAFGQAGLDETVDPDGTITSPDGIYTINWNVAEDKSGGTSEAPLPNTKKIRIIVIKNNENRTVPVVMDYLKQKNA